MHDSEAKLVERCVNGDARAWTGFVETYGSRLLNMAYRYTGNYSIAEELTQDIFVKVYQNLTSYRKQSGTLQSWVMRVGRNLIIDHYRSHRREKTVAGSEEIEVMDAGIESSFRSPFESVYLGEKARFLHRGLDRLSPELKEAVVLRDIEGFAYQEIAEMLQIPEGTVKSRINRGRIELARVLRAIRSERAS